MQASGRPWCGAPREMGGQQPCPIAEPCDERTCRIGSAVGSEAYGPSIATAAETVSMAEALRMDAAGQAARDEDQAPQRGPYTFLNQHSRVDQGGALSTTCHADGEPWPCTVARAFFAGCRSGYVTAAGRLEEEADAFRDHVGSAARRVAARLRVDAEDIDEQMKET